MEKQPTTKALTCTVYEVRVRCSHSQGKRHCSRYAHITAIGGGFGKGIHNILEAACWGVPVMFEPKYDKFKEAIDLIHEKGAASFDSFDSFCEIIDRWLSDDDFYLQSSKAASLYVANNKNATDRILESIFG